MDSQVVNLIAQRAAITYGPCAKLALYEVCEAFGDIFTKKTNYCKVYEEPKVIDDNVEYYDDFPIDIEIATDHNSIKVHLKDIKEFNRILELLFTFKSHDLQKIDYDRFDQTFVLKQGCNIRIAAEFVKIGAFNQKILLIDTINAQNMISSMDKETVKKKFFVVTCNNENELREAIESLSPKGSKFRTDTKVKIITESTIGILRIIDHQTVYLITNQRRIDFLMGNNFESKYMKMLNEGCYKNKTFVKDKSSNDNLMKLYETKYNKQVASSGPLCRMFIGRIVRCFVNEEDLKNNKNTFPG